MSELTTAQRLAAYRDELTEAGFHCSQVWDLVETVAPSLFEDLRIAADVEGDVVRGRLADAFNRLADDA